MPEFILVTEYYVVVASGEERRVNVDEIDTLTWELSHHVQIVTPEQLIWLKLRMAKAHAVDNLKR